MLVKKKRLPILKILTIGMLPSFLKKGVYRLQGMKFGKNVSLSLGSIVTGDAVEIGEGSCIGFATLIRGKNIRIGKRVEIGSLVYLEAHDIRIQDDAKIREQVQVGGIDTADTAFDLGKRSHIRQGCFINPSQPVRIGDDTAIGGRSLIFTHSTWQSALEGYPCTFAPVNIGSNVWISWDVFILPGVTVGDGTLVAAGSVVTRSLPEKCLASGNPARIVIPSGQFPRGLDPDEQVQLVNKILEEFWRYLERHTFRLIKGRKGGVLSVNVSAARSGLFKNKATFTFLFLETEDVAQEQIDSICTDIPLDSQTTVLSMVPIPYDLRVDLEFRKMMWTDLAAREFQGDNDFGRELLKFLGHYGIRLNRVDK